MNVIEIASSSGFRAGEQVYVQFSNNQRTLDNSFIKQGSDGGYVNLLDLGVFHKRTGRYEQAKEAYIEAIKLEPKRSMAYYNLGKVLYILGEYQASVKSYQTAIELGHKKLEPMRHLGYSLLVQNISASDEHVEKHYLQSIDPAKRYVYKKPTQRQIEDYEKRCAEAAKIYLESAMKE